MSIFHDITANEEQEKRSEYYVQKWGCVVYARPLSAKKLDLIQAAGSAATNAGTVLAKTVQLSVEDEDGKLIFSSPKPSERDNMMKYLMGVSYNNADGNMTSSSCSADFLGSILKGLNLSTDEDLEGLAQAYEKKSEKAPEDSSSLPSPKSGDTQ